MAMIATQGLTQTFKARTGAVEAVRGVNLEVNEGEIFGFLGPNGASKTTTLRMLATLLQPTSGKATVCSYDLQREGGRVRRQIGYVGQKGGAEASETGRENLMLQGRLYGMGKSEAKIRAAELIRERKKDFARSTQRTLYHAIDRLVKAGLIAPAEISREGNRPERTVYQLTDEGEYSFTQWLGELLEQPLPEYPLFTVAVSFLGYLPQETVQQALQTRIIELEGELAGIEARLQGLGQHLPRLLLLELEHVRALRQGELAWLQTLIQDMRQGRLTWDAEALRAHPENIVTAPDHPETRLHLLDSRVE